MKEKFLKLIDINNETTWLKRTTVMIIFMAIDLFLSSIFNDEILESGYYVYFAILGSIITIMGVASLIIYQIAKRRNEK
jgi:uncharacterized membrane protein